VPLPIEDKSNKKHMKYRWFLESFIEEISELLPSKLFAASTASPSNMGMYNENPLEMNMADIPKNSRHLYFMDILIILKKTFKESLFCNGRAEIV
tara:strand:- start:2995 stop:3279 length:285 start_codon:yes stop_codon:yes gene_type:complete